ncbi:putative glucan endo-1,3-beta-glucosidase 12 [Iris pallida]|uniref:glucan endo-1,3-beta-D-glucosidase n=1 Tax=Iris pallida TaxID=29817 RepID=A0AAX6H5A9_IRIPA|nr:putative glucan endo-1,3-beta-glucosidase 12 [Iris pallida]
MATAMATILFSLLFFSFFLFGSTSAGIVGVNYGRVANNLPSPSAVASLLKSSGITHVKLYDSDPAVLRALSGTGLSVTVALPNENLTAAATSPSFAAAWVRRSVAAYLPSTNITAVAVGNEVFAVSSSPGVSNLTSSLVPAMANIHSALSALKLDGAVKVSSPIALTALQSSYPPSAGSFRPDLAESVMRPMLGLIERTGSFLMVNAYPFFAYEANAGVIPLDYALFRPNAGVADAGSGLRYYSLLDAQVDAVFAAAGRLGFGDVRVVVSETGWPSRGDEGREVGAGLENAEAYNGNLIRRVLSGNAGTPLKPRADVDVYLFALFNENQKPGPTSERNYGLFYPNQEKVYDVEFTLKSGGGGGSGGLKSQEARGRRRDKRGSSSSGSGGSGRVTSRSTGETWCVANAVAGRERLQRALDYACGEGGADCGKIQPGEDCYDPDTVEAHASFAFNSYYQKKGRTPGACDFQGTAYVVAQSPKIGKCELPTRA